MIETYTHTLPPKEFFAFQKTTFLVFVIVISTIIVL